MQEQAEWDSVNKLLQHHGFKPVVFADPIENENLSELVLLEQSAAADVRATLSTMLMDSDRRQGLIQELIHTNTQLKEEAQQHLRRSARQAQRVVELEGVLAGVKARLQDLEDSYIGKAAQQHGHLSQLKQHQTQAQERCQALEQQLVEEKEAAAQLQRKLYFTVKEEERRVVRQNQVFQRIHRRSARPHAPVDQQVLDVVDVYEAQIQQMHDEIRSLRGDPDGDHSSDQSHSKKGTSEYKSLLKTYREQLHQAKAQREELKKEIQTLKQDLDSRPTVKELKTYKHQLRHMDRILQQNNTRGANLSNMEHNREGSNGTMSRKHLEELHQALSRLTQSLLPWQPAREPAQALRAEDLLTLVETLLEETAADEEKVLRSPTKNSLQSMVAHFQTLFDVRTLSGVYPRMNEVYTRLGEMANAMRNLRDVLALDDRATPSEVVNQVGRLVSSPDTFSGQHLHDLLGSSDIDSIIFKVKEHEEFFPAFHSLVLELLQTLDVQHLDDIIPALRSMKLRTE